MMAKVLLVALSVVRSAAAAMAEGPCDIFAKGGTPCAAAHSVVRAMYAAYDGPLYAVRRLSDGATQDINTLGAGGVADATAQDAYCSAASKGCTIAAICEYLSRP
jgi:hypothetical protein